MFPGALGSMCEGWTPEPGSSVLDVGTEFAASGSAGAYTRH